MVALDHYVWSVDLAGCMAEWRAGARDETTPPPAPHETRHWRPAEMPGRRPFDAAHRMLGSRVEPVVGDFMEMDLATLGRFDVVLYLGVLYHMEDPLRAMRRVRQVTAPGGLAVIESHAGEFPGLEGRAVCEFFPGAELNFDASNWWAPNARALEGLGRAAGFRETVVLTDRPRISYPLVRGVGRWVLDTARNVLSGRPPRRGVQPLQYRAVVHAMS